MTTESRENLSCFMDGEVDKSAGSFLVRRLANDSSLRATWESYHVIRDCLREQGSDLVQSDLCTRVREAIDQDDEVSGQSARRMAWIRPVAGVAIAASVAFIAVLSVGPGQQAAVEAGPESLSSALTSRAEPFVSPNIGNVTPASQPVNLASQSDVGQERAKAYLLRHYQATGDGAGQGFVALVPIVATNENINTARLPEEVDSAQETETP